MVSARTSIHFTVEDFNIKTLATKLIMSCNQLFIFLATAEMLREDHSAPTIKRSDLHTTELCVLTKLQRRNRTTSIDAEGNLSPDSLSLSNAREKIIRKSRVRIGRRDWARPHIATRYRHKWTRSLHERGVYAAAYQLRRAVPQGF